MKKILFIIFLISQFCYSENTPEISILTCSPGDEVYSVFGHSAIRIRDKEKSLDLVYNFGMFDFDTPHFAFKFLRGKLKYSLGIQKTEDFIQEYTNDNRLVLEQKLNLTEKKTGRLMAKLNYLYRPENREYLYSFLEKNCSTEIRDLLGDLGANFSKQDLEISNRELISSHLERNLWLRFGTNLLLGSSLDRNSSKYESMFLPKYLKEEITNSHINGIPLVKSEQTLNMVAEKNKSDIRKLFSPIVIFSLFAFLFLFWFPRSVELFCCFILGSTGLVILSMWLFSEHPEVKYNFNILWCNPLYLAYIPIKAGNRLNTILVTILCLSILSTFFVWIVDLQSFDAAIIPILIIMGLINFRRLTSTRSLSNIEVE